MDSEKTAGTAVKLKRSSRIYLCATVALAALTSLFYILSFAFSYEKEMCYFYSGSVLPAVSRVLLTLTILASAAAYFFYKKEKLSVTLPEPRGAHRFFSNFAGFVFMFDALYRVKNIIDTFSDNLIYFDSTLNDYDSYRLYRISFILGFFAVALSAGCALFFLNAAKTSKRTNSMIILGLFPVLRAAAGIASVYFDMSAAMNIPHKLITEAGLMACVLFFLAEDRLRISDSYAKPGLYVSLSLMAASLCAVSGFSQIFFYIKYSSYYSSSVTKSDLSTCFGEIFTEAFLCAVIFLYIISGIVPYLKYEGKGTADAGENAVEHDAPAAGGEDEGPAEKADSNETEQQTDKSGSGEEK